MRKKQSKGVKWQIIKFILIILALNSFVELAKGFDGKQYVLHPKASQESILEEKTLCELKDVVCEGEELVVYDKIGEFTAYNATKEQCDDSPEIMASGKKIYSGAIACPSFYEFGTKIDIDGIGEFICEDRMNIRYRNGEYFDILFDSEEKAFDFGRKKLAYRIINN